MRILSGHVKNFGSYSDLEFDFNDQGLVLIKGATGSGKSTLQDIPTWILFGVTSKNGTVDEVRNWNYLDEPTEGRLTVDLIHSQITVVRIRSNHAKDNDLYWLEDGSTSPIRGKDLTDTQLLLEMKLGVTETTYLVSATFNEFSDTGNFFKNKAKDRRALFEQIADLKFPATLQEALQKDKKQITAEMKELKPVVSGLEGELRQIKQQLAEIKLKSDNWNSEHATKLLEYKTKYEKFDEIKAQKLEALVLQYDHNEAERSKKLTKLRSKLDITVTDQWNQLELQIQNHVGDTCEACGSKKTHDYDKLLQKKSELMLLMRKMDDIQNQITHTESAVNPKEAEILRVEMEENIYASKYDHQRAQTNPYSNLIADFTASLKTKTAEFSLRSEQLQGFKQQELINGTLRDLCGELRTVLLDRTVNSITDDINRKLETYFDAEFRISLQLQGSDQLSTEITKNGIVCEYRQLSKGQRAIIRLCFATSVMKHAAHASGNHFSSLFFDEALDGMDTDLKLKTFNMFQEIQLDHPSVFVIDHTPEFHSLFTKKFHVELVNEESVLTEET